MKSISSQELKDLRNKFRESKQHKYLSEVSLVADKDSTALFNVAWMQQIIPYLMGKPHDLGKRVFNIQRCIRTVDIDEVWDASHLTFFEMMGNRSLGDYFKKESVLRSWEFLVSPEYLDIDPRKLAVTTFQWDENAQKDEETFWYRKNAGISEDRISYLPAKHNRWSPGPVWPCWPDTEIFYRVGAGDLPPAGSNVENDEDNRLEIWNNVFMEFYRDETGTLTKLKQQNVDTGMWFERMCKVLQGKETIYETDLFWPIIQKIEKLTAKKYTDNLRRMRIVADHLRTSLRLAQDGLFPSNEGRWYVMRMIIRRMYYNLMLINDISVDQCNEFILASANYFGETNKPEVIIEEINWFRKTISNWTKLLDQMLSKTKDILSGKDIFMLYDSYGFPLELTKEIATEKWINVDEVLFQAALEEAREKSRQWTKEMFKKWTDRSMHLEWIQATKFIWYEQLQSEDIKLIKDFVVDWKRILIFDKTPFYAESGGQTGDRGSIILDSGETVKIQDVKKYEWVFLHFLG